MKCEMEIVSFSRFTCSDDIPASHFFVCSERDIQRGAQGSADHRTVTCGAGHLHSPLDDPLPPSVATPATSNTWRKYNNLLVIVTARNVHQLSSQIKF
jgi:hypothetical protein